MEFTHQHLNKDFMTLSENKAKTDDFADFLSIVDAKYEKDKKKCNLVK